MNQSIRIPPHSPDVERFVLASCLISSQAAGYAIENLSDEVFYSYGHKSIYEAVRGLISRGAPVDMVTVSDELIKTGHAEAADALSELYVDSASSANIEHHCAILVKKASLRALITASQEITAMAYDDDADEEIVIAHAETIIGRIADKKTKTAFETPQTILPRTMDAIERRMTHGTTNLGTGFSALDELTCGMSPGDLILLAARPSMGKTSMAFGIALHIAKVQKKPVAIFELEMTKTQLIEKALSHEGEIDSMAIRSGRLTKQGLQKLGEAAGPIFSIPLYIDDNPYLSITQARTICRRLRLKHGIELFIFDYLQLMEGNGKGTSKNDDVSSITRGLKGIAKECNAPVIALSQLSRACEQRSGDHRPQLSDLRDSGAIEQDADVVMFIYRECVYNTSADCRKAEIIVAKQRNGPTGTVAVNYKNWCTKFENQSIQEGDF